MEKELLNLNEIDTLKDGFYFMYTPRSTGLAEFYCKNGYLFGPIPDVFTIEEKRKVVSICDWICDSKSYLLPDPKTTIDNLKSQPQNKKIIKAFDIMALIKEQKIPILEAYHG